MVVGNVFIDTIQVHGKKAQNQLRGNLLEREREREREMCQMNCETLNVRFFNLGLELGTS